MANPDLTSPLLQQPSQSELVITIDELESEISVSNSIYHHQPNSIPIHTDKINHMGHLDFKIQDDPDPNSFENQSSSAQIHLELKNESDPDSNSIESQPLSRNGSEPYEFLSSGDFVIPDPTTVDPFRNHTEKIEGVYEWVKILVCLPIVVVRLLLFGACLLVGFVATKLALAGWKDRQSPMPKWRSRIMWVTRISTRLILFSFGYHWIKRKGRPAPRETAPIIVSNHVSYIEPIFFFYELFPTIVASESHDSLPVVGTIIRAMQVIFVNRFSTSSRKQAVSEIKRKASSGRFPRVLIFPEGTTTNGRAMLSFQLGAFIPGYAIQPVIVRYPHVHFDQSWGHISVAKLMFRMFTQFHNFMEVEYLPVVLPRHNRKENAVGFAVRTSHAMAHALNVVQTSHSYGDLMLLTKASKSNQENPLNYMVEMAKVESSFHLSTMEAVEFLDKYILMNPDARGCVDIHHFLKVLKLKACTLSEKIFGFLDVEKNGIITFRQFIFGSAHVLKQPLFRRACELAFSECDMGANNHITEQEFGDTIRPAIPDLNTDEIHELFKMFDADCDGRISSNEFLTCLRKNPLLIALFASCLSQNDLFVMHENVLEEMV